MATPTSSRSLSSRALAAGRARGRVAGALLTALAMGAAVAVAAAPPAQAGATPVVGVPVTSFPPAGTTIPLKATGVVQEVVTWKLLDPGTNGFSHYILEQFNTYESSWNTVYYGTGTIYQALLPINQFTEFRLTPFDGGGVPGITTYGQGFVPSIADDSDTSAIFASPMAFAHGWTRTTAATAFGGSYHRSSRRHSQVVFCGAFTQVALIGPRTAAGGTGSVVAFGSASSVGFSAPSPRYREVLASMAHRRDRPGTRGGWAHVLLLLDGPHHQAGVRRRHRVQRPGRHRVTAAPPEFTDGSLLVSSCVRHPCGAGRC